jgi:trk system potassium uptake protein TrkA
MFVVIVGGGQVGSHLAAMLLAGGHEVHVIDERKEVLAKIHRELPTETIFEGDGSDPDMLRTAGIERANVVAAVTGSDETNLMVTHIARFEFNVPRIIGRVNSPKNAWLFTADMGVDVAINQSDIMAKLIAEEMSLGDMMTMLKLRRGEIELVEEKITPGAVADGQFIRDLQLPEDCTLAAIIRKGEVIVPRGNTRLEAGDEILAVVKATERQALATMLGRRT